MKTTCGRLYAGATTLVLALTFAAPVTAQTNEDESETLEEITVVGSQIRGARINDALPVSVVSFEDIEAFGIDSGDELLDFLPENGNNFFNEAENISGGVNAARGDVGAFNLRSMGTGNTLVLLNGRRLVLAPQFQTEEIGGSFVPVNTVNSNTIPVFGVERVEVLRDGASAIYGADAVAGVVNTVLKSDLEGFSVRTRFSDFDNFGRNDAQLTFEWGDNFNNDRTNVGVFFNYYDRGRVSAQEDERWADSDFRPRVPAGSPWEDDIRFRNNSINTLFGQYDLLTSASDLGINGTLTDNSGEFQTYPAGDARCTFAINEFICGAPDNSDTVRYNLNEVRDVVSDLQRASFFVYINHELANGIESFTELSYYDYESNLSRHPSTPFSTVKLRVGAENFYNPFGPCGSPNRLPDSVIGTNVPCEGLTLEIDNYRFAELPRIVNNSGDAYRVLQGFRGAAGSWDWETAVTWSRSTVDDVTSNRVSNTLMQQALEDPTEAAYNPFSGGVNSNIERALVDVSRRGETELRMFDVKFSNPEIFEGWAGPAAALIGAEYREETFEDDRDDRLDGTIVFTDFQGDTYPFVSDVVNSSPTPDSSGERDVTSLFAELQMPLTDSIDFQAAVRFEDHSDSGTTTVPKLALGWRVVEPLLLRASWSEGFRAPNLVTVNEDIVARQNTRDDYACIYAAENGGDPDQDILDCRNSVQRIAQGSENLQPEESESLSIGLVYEPIQGLTFTFDYWEIEKNDTIGLFGEENHTLLDLVQRLEAGTGNCAAFQGNPAITRAPQDDDDALAVYAAAGICPAGDIQFIDDRYANLNTRTFEGFDIGIYYNFDLPFGNFNIRYVGSFLETFEQEPGGDALVLLDAQAAGLLPSNYPVAGFDDLIRRDGNQQERMNLTVAWRNGNWGASATALYIGDFYQDSLTIAGDEPGDPDLLYEIPSMVTINVRADYTYEFQNDWALRTRIGINNIDDERAPLADRFFGYFADSHRDLGRSYYLDLRLRF